MNTMIVMSVSVFVLSVTMAVQSVMLLRLTRSLARLQSLVIALAGVVNSDVALDSLVVKLVATAPKSRAPRDQEAE